MITENKITSILRQHLEPLPYVYALWIEGSYALGTADEYSDIDYWVDVADDKVEEVLRCVEVALLQLGELDEKDWRESSHTKLGQIVYHIKGSNPYLVLDFNWQKHSRDRSEYHYMKDDIVEGAKVIFDKDQVIRFVSADENEIKQNKENCRKECDYRYSQHIRVEKYMKRNAFPESYAYYNKYVIEPLVMMLRLKYTPLYPYHYLLHISSHMPNEVVERLTKLIQISSLKDMQGAIEIAQAWYKELSQDIFGSDLVL